MNKTIALTLLKRLEGAPYLDRTSGIVQVLIRKEPVSDDPEAPMIEKRLPYAHDASLADFTISGKAMVPNSAWKSCLYFEDGGTTVSANSGRAVTYTSRLRLVCWLNSAKAFGAYATIETTRAMADIIARITSIDGYSDGFFTRMKARVANIPAQNAAIFQDYDYSEVDTQYLMPPFDFFALDLDVTYTIPHECTSRQMSGLDYLTDEQGVILTDEGGNPLIA